MIKIKEDQEKINKLKTMLDYLYDIGLLDYMFDGDLSSEIFSEIDDKYLIDKDQYSFSDDDEEVESIKSQGIEWFGENYGLSVKDGEYCLLSLDMIVDDMKYWFISKIDTNDVEKAREIAYLLNFFENIEDIRIKKNVRQSHLSNNVFEQKIDHNIIRNGE